MKAGKIIGNIVLLLLGLVFTSLGLLAYKITDHDFQTNLTHRVTGWLTGKLGSQVYIGRTEIDFFSAVVLKEVLVLDQQQDTLLSAAEVNVSLSVFRLLQKRMVIERIALKQPHVFLHRDGKTEEWNYQFIADTFSSDKPKQPSSSTLELDLKNLDFSEVHFVMLDEPNHTQLDFTIPSLAVDARHTDFNQPRFDLRKILLDRALIRITKLQRPVDTSATVMDTGIIHINTKPFELLVEDFRIRHARFVMDDLNEPYDTAIFDGMHMDFTELDIHFTDCSLLKDTIAARIENISLKEQSGFTARHLEGDARVTTTMVKVTNLKLETPYTSAKDSFSFRYGNFSAFNDFNQYVELGVSLKQSKLSLKDIGFFIPGLAGMTETLMADGVITGTVSQLKGKNLQLLLPSNTRFAGDIHTNGLPEAEETFIDLTIDELTTSSRDLSRLMPRVSWPAELDRAGNLTYRGSFTGFYNDFVTFGTFSTSVGTLNTDLNLKFKEGFDKADYSGYLAGTDFNLGRLLNQDSLLGKITFTTTLNGKGFELNTMSAAMDGTIEKIEFNDYAYRNTAVDGRLDSNIFNGNVNINDPNIRLDFAGLIDFNRQLPYYNFKAKLDSANLQALQLTDEPYTVSSLLDLDLRGNSIDDFAGDARLENLTVSLDQESWTADTIVLAIEEIPDSNTRKLFFHAPFGQIQFDGRFALAKLPQSFLSVVNYYFPSMPGEYSVNDSVQDFSFNITLRNASEAIEFFLPEWRGIEATQIDGFFSSRDHRIDFRGKIPALAYRDFDFGDVYLGARTSADSLHISGGSRSIVIGDSTRINDPRISLLVRNDSAMVKLNGKSPDSTSYVNLNTHLTADSLLYRLHIRPSDLVYMGRRWTFSPDNEISYGEERLIFKNFSLTSDQRKLAVSNVNLRVRATNLALEFYDLPLSDFRELTSISGYDLAGDLNGSMQILNALNEPRIDANTTIRDFSINGEQISSVAALVNYTPETDALSIEVQLDDARYAVAAKGSVFLSRQTEQLDLTLQIQRADPAVVEALFFSELINSTSGSVSGELRFGGTFDQMELTGAVMLDSFATQINYLKTTYRCYRAPINFNKDHIDLGKLTLFDQNGDRALAAGRISHRYLDEFSLDVSITTERFLVLNTTAKDDSVFYGTAEAAGLIRFLGPVENIDISANVKSLRGTKISIPISEGSALGERSYIRYLQPNQDSAQLVVRRPSSLSGMRMSFNMTITPEAIVQIIFDAATGDIIEGRGTGDLRMEVDLKGEFNMYGLFTIKEGNYLFTQFNYFNKNFVIENGGTINWTGDPYEAKINFSAIYTTRASLYELVPNASYLSSSEIKDLQDRTRVDLYLILTGSLFSPQISFDIRLPETSTLNTTASLAIERIKRDENELNKQAFGILVLGHFLPQESGLGGQSISTDVNNSLSSFISNQISSLASSFRDDIDFTVNYQAYETAVDPASADVVKRNELQVALTKRFFNDRLAVDVGGNFDFDASGSASASSNVAGDFAIEYKITPDGRVSGKVFSKSNYDFIDATNKQNNGVSLKYSRDFDQLKELLRDPEKKKRKQQRRQLKNIGEPSEAKEEKTTSVK